MDENKLISNNKKMYFLKLLLGSSGITEFTNLYNYDFGKYKFIERGRFLA